MYACCSKNWNKEEWRAKNSYAEAVLWNYLHSTDLKRMETVFAFKSGLETLFFQTETRIINLFYVCVTTL